MNWSGRANIVIRSFTSSEKELVNTLAREAGNEPDEIETILTFSKIMIAVVDGNSAGMTAYHISGSTLIIDDIAVKEEYRRMGIASALLDYVKDVGEQEKCHKIEITSTNDNIPALACYQRFGFNIKEVRLGSCILHHGGEEKGWSGIPVRDEIVLELHLGVP
jgi:ribosomal protein S18 acetylase RimI-like enzyme